MASVQSSAIKVALRLAKILRTPLTADNLAQKRAAYARLVKYFPVSQSVVINPVNADGVKAEWLTTTTSRPTKIMLFMHGGGFVFNSTKLHRDLIARIASSARVTALSIDYSLAPENPFPTALNEVVTAYKWLLSRNVLAKDIALVGDSAGGSLVLSALHVLRDEGQPLPCCAVAIAPATDATRVDAGDVLQPTEDLFINPQTLTFFIDAYFKDTPHDHPHASPQHGSLKGFPPLLLHAAKNETLHTDAARFVAKAKQHGVDARLYQADGLWHVWHLYARYLPEARAAIRDIGHFINQHITTERVHGKNQHRQS